MTPGDMAPGDMDSAITAARAVIAGIGEEQWAAPTPCAGVDVRALVNHLVAGNLHFAALVSQTPRPEPDADHLGADPLAAFDRAAAALRAAMARPGVLAGTYPLPFGPVPGAELARIRIVEHLGHGWDLARATGQRAGFAEDVAERALAAAKRRPAGPGSAFGPPVPVPANAPAIDRLAGFLGRTV